MDAKQFLDSLDSPLTRRGDGSSTPKQVAERIRKEIAQAIEAGALPAGTKVSVRNPRYSSIDVDIVAWQGAVFRDEYVASLMGGDPFDDREYRRDERRRGFDPRYAHAMSDALWLLHRIANRHNYDNSDITTDYFDVGYYLDVGCRPVASAAEQGIREEVNPAMAALRALAIAKAATLEPRVVRSLCGSAGIDGAGDWTMKRVIKLADYAAGRKLVYDKRRRAWIVSDDTAPTGQDRGVS